MGVLFLRAVRVCVCVCVGASARGRCRLCRRTSRLPEAGLQRGVEGHVRGVLKNTTAPHTDGGPPAPNPPRGAGAGGCYPKPWPGGEAPGPPGSGRAGLVGGWSEPTSQRAKCSLARARMRSRRSASGTPAHRARNRVIESGNVGVSCCPCNAWLAAGMVPLLLMKAATCRTRVVRRFVATVAGEWRV